MTNSKSQPLQQKKQKVTQSEQSIIKTTADQDARASTSVEVSAESEIIIKAIANPLQVIEVEEDVVDPALLKSIDEVLASLKITKVYFVDDAVGKQTDMGTFLGLVRTAMLEGKIDQLRAIPIQNAINFQIEEDVLPEHIGEVWDGVPAKKQLKYFERLYTINGQPNAMNDINVSSHLENFFSEGILTCLKPEEWDQTRDDILNQIPENERILVLFDQDLKLAGGRFTEQQISGEDLIRETKAIAADKVVMTLFTHTVPDYASELPERQRICGIQQALEEQDFFVLTKKRLDNHDEFADGLKKACLNTYCEQIKTDTLTIVLEAQKRTIERIKAFDTYEFDQAVFKSSFTEGVWEPETLLRITDTIFKDEVRRLMLDEDYMAKTNNIIQAAREISGIDLKTKNLKTDHTEKFKIRHQELYENPEILNPLGRPIDNGDLFKITSGARQNKTYVLIAQECDLMVRSEGQKRGNRGTNMAVLAEVIPMPKEKMLTDQSNMYKKQIEHKKFSNHYFADRFQLSYFQPGSDKVGIVEFKNTLLVDLNILDLGVFDRSGKTTINLADPSYIKDYHNEAWRARYELINTEYTKIADELDVHYAALNLLEDEGQRNAIKSKINRVLSFINPAGIIMNYDQRKFDFGIERIGRVRLPKSKYLLDMYYKHVSRFAEQHDFAQEI